MFAAKGSDQIDYGEPKIKEVESAAIRGDYKDEIEVTGERIDSVKLTRLLRKKFCYADLVSDSDLGKKEEKKEEAIVAWLNYVPLKLTRLLRKKFCYADLASVSDVEKKEEAIVAWPNYVNCVPHYNYPDVDQERWHKGEKERREKFKDQVNAFN
ncbi:hypothetical protein KIW84_053095 [Lathyrus oleraceus]|uniref:Uncharacterized protein n=1 Tax=Pisum sativum TaxID=3888 RepID=A0A9D4WRT3_PEA|nr:hypothetical protein KIW84_053095 [Pisum sativum]